MSDKYISNYTGSQIDEAVGLLNGKGLNTVVGIIKRGSTGSFGAVQKSDITALGIPAQDTTYTFKTINGQIITGEGNIAIQGVQSDWEQVDDTQADFIQNKPNLNLKQDKLVSGTNIKTIGGQSILGSGDLQVYTAGTGIDITNNIISISLDNAEGVEF